MLELSRALVAQGLAVDLLVGGTEGELKQEIPEQVAVVEMKSAAAWRVRMWTLAADPGNFGLVMRRKMRPLKSLRLRCLPDLVGYIRRARPDAVLASEAQYNLMAVWARRLAGHDCRLVLSEHIQASRHAIYATPWGQPQLLPLLRCAYLKADAIVAVSDGVADDLAAHADIPRQRITTVYNPVVGPNLVAKAEQAPDHPWLAPGQPPVILGVGRLHPQKDFATLIRAFARLRAERRARLIILGAAGPGSPGGAEELKALAAQLGIAEDVDMPGFDHNPFGYMSRAAVFALSSIYEGLGNVLIEAMACGTPVVSTDCPSGPREILDHGRYGPLVPVGDDAALAHAIEGMLDNPPAALSLRARAELFTVERAVDNYLRLLFPAGENLPGRAVA